MCPECFSSAALVVGGILSTGGVSALAVTMFRPKKSSTDSQQRRNDDGNTDKQQSGCEDRDP